MNWKKLLDEHIEEVILVLTMTVMVVVIFAQSSSRLLFNSAVSWGSELARYLHIWQIWIGASLAIRKGNHVRVDIVVKKFPKKIVLYLNLLALLCWFGFAVFLAISGMNFVFRMMDSGQTSAAMQLPMWMAYIAIPLAGLLMAIRLVQQIYFLFKGEK